MIPGFHFQKSGLNRAFISIDIGPASSRVLDLPDGLLSAGSRFLNIRPRGQIFRVILHRAVTESFPLGQPPGTIRLIVESFQDGVDPSSLGGKFFHLIQLHQEIAIALAGAILQNASADWWLWTPPAREDLF